VLLGVATAAGGGGRGDPQHELSLQPLPEYSVPSDNVIMASVAGTAAGRIFMGGADGRLYELKYGGGGRGGKCKKVRCAFWTHVSLAIEAWLGGLCSVEEPGCCL